MVRYRRMWQRKENCCKGQIKEHVQELNANLEANEGSDQELAGLYWKEDSIPELLNKREELKLMK